MRRCLLPHCPRLTANNKNVLPSTNVTSYYLCLVSYAVPRAFLLRRIPRFLSLSLSLSFYPFAFVTVTKRPFIKLLREHIPRKFAWKVFRPVIALHRHTYTRARARSRGEILAIVGLENKPERCQDGGDIWSRVESFSADYDINIIFEVSGIDR